MTALSSLAADAANALTTRPQVPLALATLVHVSGSSYRQPGARLLVDGEGRVLSGAISGGCLEGDVAAQASAVIAEGAARRLVYDLRDDLETIWGFGTACDGIATIVLEPIAGSWLAEANAVRESRVGGAIVMHVGSDVEAPLGTLAIIHAGGDIRPVALKAAADDGAPALTVERWVGMADAGLEHPSLFVDPIVPPVALHVVGAGRGAEAFASIAATLGWEVTLLDHRAALLEALKLPGSASRQVASADDAAAALAALPTDGRTAVALMTHHGFEIERDRQVAQSFGLARPGAAFALHAGVTPRRGAGSSRR